MFSPAIEKQRRQLYSRTIEHLEERLEKVHNPADMFAALRWGMAELDRAYDETPAKIRSAVACHAGCDHCCSVAVDVQAHEVFLAAEHIQLHFSPDELARVIARTAERRAHIAAHGRDSTERPRRPCALLADDGRCGIYKDRPEACRVHHTSDAKTCAAYAEDATVDIDAVYIPPLRARLFAVMLGMDEAIETAGYDDRAYDFNAALHEALTNSLTLTLWMRGKPAFPDSCLAG